MTKPPVKKKKRIQTLMKILEQHKIGKPGVFSPVFIGHDS